MVCAKVEGRECDFPSQKPFNKDSHCVVASLRGIMEGINGRLDLFIKTVHSKHGYQGNEAMWPQIDNLLPKLQPLFFFFC